MKLKTRIKPSIIVLWSVFCFFIVSDFYVGVTAETSDAARDCLDNDGDHFCLPEDCDDNDPSIYPGAPEIPGDGIDQNCDGMDACLCYVDQDNDGFGNAHGNVIVSPDGDCDDDGEAYAALDCNDLNCSIYPGAPEIANDGIDQDCNGLDLITISVEPMTWSCIKALYSR